MSLIFCDSFDHYGSPEIGEKWSHLQGVGASIETTIARTGHSLSLIGFNSTLAAFGSIDSTLICGFALRVTTYSPGALLSFYRRFGTPGPQVTVGLDSTGHFVVWVGPTGGTVIGTSTATLPLNQWHYLECKATFDFFNGEVELLLDNSSILHLTSVQTSTSFDTSADVLVLNGDTYFVNGRGRGLQWYVDDLYFLDSQGGINDNFLFSPAVVALDPSGEGDFDGWVPHGAVPNWRCVNGGPPGAWDSYVSTSTPGELDLYAVPIPGFDPIYAVQLCVRHRWVGSPGGHAVQGILQSGGNQFPGRDSAGLGPAYTCTPWDTDPNTGNPWNGYAVGAAQWGQQID
jgi:hypothetical protein